MHWDQKNGCSNKGGCNGKGGCCGKGGCQKGGCSGRERWWYCNYKLLCPTSITGVNSASYIYIFELFECLEISNSLPPVSVKEGAACVCHNRCFLRDCFTISQSDRVVGRRCRGAFTASFSLKSQRQELDCSWLQQSSYRIAKAPPRPGRTNECHTN